MKKLIYLLALIISFIIFTPTTQAFEVKIDDSVILNKEELADGNVYASCSQMTIDGTVNGDIIAICKNIVINGTVNGDLIAFSQDITINGEIKGSARLAGTNIKINGLINHNLNAFGTEITLNPSSVINWDVLVYGVNGYFDGVISGTLHGDLSSAKIAGKIGKNINLNFDDHLDQVSLLLTKDAVVGGDVTYQSKKEASIESPSTVAGKINHQTNTEKNKPLDFLFNLFYKLSALILIGLVLVSLKKSSVYSVAKTLETKNWQSLLIGLAALILSPIVILLFLMTLVGAPLALILLALYLILILLALIFSAFFIGQIICKSIFKKDLNPFIILVLGLTIVALLNLIPYLGGSLIFILICSGFGATLINIKKNLYA